MEVLLGTAAGDPKLFEHKRRRAAAKERLDELQDTSRLAKLPKRPRYEEPGSIRLPYYCFRWLRDVGKDRRKTGNWTVGDLGFLSVMLHQFANRISLFPSGRFEETATGEPRLIVSTGGRQAFTLGSNINPEIDHLGVGPVG